MKKIRIWQVDAFTVKVFSGNPAGVVLQAGDLTDLQMQQVAREMNCSQTAFVLPPMADGDLRLRCFTPAVEVDLCGHATLAAFHVLVEEKQFGLEKKGAHRLQVETKAGKLAFEVDNRGEGLRRGMLSLPLPKFAPVKLGVKDFAKMLGIRPEDFNTDLPIVKDHLQVVVPLASLAALLRCKPDFERLREISKKLGVLGVAPMTLGTVELESKVHTRFFAPAVGINEDPVTGTSQGPIGVYLAQQGVLPTHTDRITYTAEQGDAVGRPGRVIVEMKLVRREVVEVKVGGYAVTAMRGEMVLA